MTTTDLAELTTLAHTRPCPDPARLEALVSRLVGDYGNLCQQAQQAISNILRPCPCCQEQWECHLGCTFEADCPAEAEQQGYIRQIVKGLMEEIQGG